ncbi:MAG: matrixin family metalloprotease [Bryobacteraceae bacterium]|jgi:hypothetical protein
MNTRKLAALMAWMAVAGACYGAQEQVAVVIFDEAGVPAAVLKSAADTAREAFREVGVDTKWSVCRVSENPSEHCTLPPAGTYLQAKVVPPALEHGLESREALGYAVSPKGERGVVSYAFYEPVKKFAEGDGQSVSLVLGYVMAHEIGHLLGMKHSPSGIMKPQFDRRDLRDAASGFLHFTAPDAKALRASAGH